MDVKEEDILSRVENSLSDSFEEPVVETVIITMEKEENKECHSEDDRRDLGQQQQQSPESEQFEPRTDENSSDSVAETQELRNSLVVIVAGEANSAMNTKIGELGKVSVEESKSKKSCEADKRSCVIDMSCVEKWDGESVCRICHLSSDQSPERRTTATSVSDLIHLGCGCKDDLGITHFQCAEAWFKLKGNRVCEICGESAKNVTGVGDVRFMEEWNERFGETDSNSGERRRGCWRGQPFCNFLMACLVIAFVLPWFFRVNMF